MRLTTSKILRDSVVTNDDRDESCSKKKCVRTYRTNKVAEFSATDLIVASTSIESSDESSLKIEWLNSEEAAIVLRISVKALRNMTSNGKLPFYKMGRRNRYRRDELEAQLLSQKRGK